MKSKPCSGMRSDSRAKALNALRQWIDELDSGRYPGLYLLITGTPAFFDGRLGIQSLPPLAQSGQCARDERIPECYAEGNDDVARTALALGWTAQRNGIS